jgi:very-short-patch-repair endonuclease
VTRHDRGVAIETSFGPHIGGKSQSGPDRDVAALANRQHGVVSRPQLLEIGLGERAIEHRITRGLLHPIHRGVYAVGHGPQTREARWLAAVLAAGPDAVLGFRFGAALWCMRNTSRLAVEVITPRVCRRPGIHAHQIALPADEVTIERGIPVTTPARTLFDLAAVVTTDQLEHAFNEAEVRRLSSPTSLDALLARYPGRRGTQAIRRVLEKHRLYGETRTRSELERKLISLLDAHRLPRPQVNRFTDDGELDARWPEHGLIVECDGFAAHGTRRAFEDDRARDRALTTAGWRVVRLTWRQLSTDGDTIAAQLQTLLDQPAASRRPAHSSTARSWAS